MANTTHKITTTFDNSVSYVSGKLSDIKQELKHEARKSGRNINEYIITKLL